MNIEAYISSGILEAYAFGELSDLERAEVEANLKQYPDLRQELSLIEETQEDLLMKAATSPRAVVKENLFAKLEAKKPATKVIPLTAPVNGQSFWKLAAAASVSIALIASYLAYDYRSKWLSTDTRLTDLIAQNQRVAQDYNTVNQRLDQMESDLQITNNPDFSRVIMKGTANAPGALASVYWNASTREVYLNIKEMRELSGENQYQLWAIIDGKPVDAGVFDSDFSGLLKMKEIAKGATTFAVTIEQRGGSASPTLETMQVAGNV